MMINPTGKLTDRHKSDAFRLPETFIVSITKIIFMTV
jgi:hypothetical protein